MSQASSAGKDGDQWLPHQIAVPSAAPGPPVLIRQAAASDRPALAEMLARCSDQTRERRFHKYVRFFPEPYLTEALAGCAAHFALLAQAGQAVVALASCVATDRGSAELAVLVEDSWQRLGVGDQLLSLLVAHADQSGLARLKAWVLGSQAWVLPVLGGYGTCEAWLRHGVFEVTVHRERGYVGTSPKSIQQLADVGQASMYHHFSGKEELARAAIDRTAGEMRAGTDAQLSGPGTALDRISAYLRRERDVLKGCPNGRLAQDPGVMAVPVLREPIEETFTWLHARLTSVVTEGIGARELSPAIDPAATASAIVAALQGGYVLARAAGSTKPFEQAIGGILALLGAYTVR